MTETPFRTVVRGLFAKLGLPAPRFDDTGIVRLKIEAFGVNLTDGGSGLLLIEGVAGALPVEGAEESRQIRRILKANAGFLLGNEAGAFLRAQPGLGDALVVRSTYPLAAGDLDRLVGTIEDTLYLMEHHASELSMKPVRPVATAAAQGGLEDILIFRP